LAEQPLLVLHVGQHGLHEVRLVDPGKAQADAVGYSLGGNVLLKYLGETAGDCPLLGGVAVSVPFRLDECADRIGLG
ncbi:hypothetical protein QM291_31190, partial [Pseudomonas aeruginosa]|nr:hypothetical protein [Pseudomonas aeruginosa]